MSRPRLFVGSSTEGKEIAHAVRYQLKDIAEVSLWSDDPFGLNQGNLESLVRALDEFDFAVLVITADDVTISRQQTLPSPRDNVVFEAGLFMGRLGRDRTFLVYDSSAHPKLPSDLAGITVATFQRRASGKLTAAVGEATDSIRNSIKDLGPYLILESPSAGERVGREIRASGKCSTRHTMVGVVVHPLKTQEYWLQAPATPAPDGTWDTAIYVGAVNTPSGNMYEIRAFLDPTPSNQKKNPLPWWPSAVSSTKAIRVKRG